MNLLLVIVLSSAPPATTAECLRFEPDTVTLSGTLTVAAFPGRPNYEDTLKGDEPEHPYIVTLDWPICVRGDSTSDLNADPQPLVRSVQLLFVPPLSPYLRSHVGKAITVMGRLTS